MKKLHFLVFLVFALATNVWGKKIAPLIEFKPMDSLGSNNFIERGSDLLSGINTNAFPSPPTWKSEYCYNSSKATLTLKVKDYLKVCIPNFTNYQVNFRVTYLKFDNTLTTFDTVLNINYNNNKGLAYKEKAIYVKENVHYIKAEILSISDPNLSKYACLEAKIEEDRTYCGFNPTSTPSFTQRYSSTTDEIILQFDNDFSKKCDYIEVEYQFIDAYNSNGLNSYLPKSSIWFDFRRNANRVAIKSNLFNISNIFEDGYLVIRARGVVFINENQPILGNWSVTNYGDLSQISNNNIVTIGQNGSIPVKEPNLNWQYQAEFAEDAKKKEVMTFFDGLLKNRQTVTRSNTEYIAIVVENIYDHLGRPAISTLPAPSNENNIKYYKDFNTNVNNIQYNPTNFEIIPNIADCDRPNYDDPMHGQQGAANYYSGDNSLLYSSNTSLQKQLAAYIPNSSGFPFTHTEYMPDQTSRIRRQSGAGSNLKLGQGHEIKYFYGVPTPIELYKLFGTEAGYHRHYKKNMVIDPNGQVSISYLDAKGRVIATNLAGNNQTNLQNLSNNTGAKDVLETDLTDPIDTTLENGSLIVNKTFNVGTNNTKYDLKYSLDPQTYIPECNKNLVCYDCIYDLEIKLVNNECNDVVFNIKRKIGNGNNAPDISCSTNPSYSFLNEQSYTKTDSFISLNLNVGNYTLTKKLSVNNAAFEYYLTDYLTNRLCKSKEDFLTNAYKNFDTTQCEQTCESCYEKLGTKEAYIQKRKDALVGFSAEDVIRFGEDWEDQKRFCGKLCEKPKTGCDAILETLKGDFRPGGQYAKYTYNTTTNLFTADMSIPTGATSALNVLSASGGFSSTYLNHPYFTSHGITVNGTLKLYSSFTVDEIINNWQDTFTNLLVVNHPEYCKYAKCVEQNINDDFIDDFLNTESHSEALAKGYLDPVGTTIVDPFFKATMAGNSSLTSFRNKLSNYLVQGSTSFDIKDVAIINMYCNDDNNPSNPTNVADLLNCVNNHRNDVNNCVDNQNFYWNNFKTLYYAERQKITDAYIKSVCPAKVNGYEERFPENKLQDQLAGDPNTTAGINAIKAQTAAQVAQNCLNTCNGYKDHWRNSLKNCVLTASEMEIILDNLVGVCIVECNEKNPFGASNLSLANQAPPNKFYSFNDVLKGNNHLASTSLKPYVKGICDDVFITMPSALGHDYLSYNNPYADTCACDPVLYNNTGTGVSANITETNEKCNNCSPTASEGLNSNIKLAMASLKGSDKKFKCKNCIDCCAYKKAMYQFVTDYDMFVTSNNNSFGEGQSSPISPSYNYDKFTILTNYLNNKLGFNLSYEDYISFGANCFNTSPTFESIVQLAYTKKTNNDTIGDCAAKTLPPNSNAYFFVKISQQDIGASLFPSYNRNIDIDTCGCNKILLAEADYTNGKISNTQYASAKDYIEKVFNGGIPLNNYNTYKTICTSTVSNSNYSTVFNLDGTRNWRQSIHETQNNIASLTSLLHETALNLSFMLTKENLFNINSCGDVSINKILCNKPFNEVEFTVEDPCKARLKSLAKLSAENAFSIYKDSMAAVFKNAYYAKCLRPLQIERFVEKIEQIQYQYTLYYYDQAGNLAKTVPPKGFKPLSNNDAMSVYYKRKNRDLDILVPSHQMATLYKYNTLQNLIWQKTPDAGVSNFYYDYLGRLVISQNAKQAKTGNNQYSYTVFDGLGRITEVGQLVNSDPLIITNGIVTNSNYTTFVATTNKTQITRTYYDEANSNIVDPILFNQQNLRGRVVYTTYSGENIANNYDHGVHYSYDIHGNVKMLMREIKALKALAQDYKITEYDYDLVSGKVNNVYYQKGQIDQYMHHYDYDAENRLIDVQSGPTTNQLDEDAAYFYYRHGPLARVELGVQKVQGIDYAYTLQGWLKGVNTAHINSYKDIGRDGYNGIDGFNGNSHLPIDEYGYSLNYFEGDYQPIGLGNAITNTTNFVASTLNASLNNDAPNLYNGNIRMMTVAIRQFGYAPIANAYKYDQLNRLVESNTYNTYDSINNQFTASGGALTAYKNAFTYDENGNILTQLRNGSATTPNLDNLTYEYYNDGSEPTNKLKRVRDNVSSSNYTDDIDDQGIYEDNYVYDEIGNLIKDNAEQIDKIEWNVYGKIRKITRTNNSSKPDLEFEYTPDGHRAVKIVKPKDGSMSIYTYYVRDAQGNILATYTRNFSKTIDYANITYTQINDKIIEKAGINAFANFISAYSNNAGLKTNLLTNLGSQELLLRSFSPHNLLSNHSTAFDDVMANLSNTDFLDVFLDPNIDFTQFCNCFSERKNTNPNEDNLLEALFKYESGIQLVLNELRTDYVDDLTSKLGLGGSSTQDKIDNIKLYLLDPSLSAQDRKDRYTAFFNSLKDVIDLTDCNDELIKTLLNPFQNNPNDVKPVLALLPNIKEIFYNPSNSFSCNLNITKSNAINMLNNFPDLVWSALLQSQTTNYWLTWLKANDPDFLYKASYFSPTTVSNYQAANNIYGGTTATIGKQNYFVNMRNGLGQSTYDQIITYFLGQSSVYIDSMNLSEWHIYGSSRLGIYQTSINMAYRNVRIVNGVTTQETNTTVAWPSYTLFDIQRGAKRYELTNHLGNVLVVVTDKKISNCPTEIANFNFSTTPNLNGAWNLRNSFQGQNATLSIVNQKLKLEDNQTADPHARLNYFMPADLVPNHVYKTEITIDKQKGTGVWYLDIFYGTTQNSYGGSTTRYNLAEGVNTLTFTAPGYIWRYRFIYSNAQEDIEYTFDNFKITDITTGETIYYIADVVSATDYSAFGVPLEGRSYTAPNISYRFGGAGGQEKDNEIFKGAYTAEYWEYDSRLGRRWNIDPLTYPWQSSYCVFNNNPICFVDPQGLEGDKPQNGDTRTTSEGCDEVFRNGAWNDCKYVVKQPLKDVIIKGKGAGKPDYSYQDWYNKYKKPELERQLEQFRQSIYKNTAYFPSTSGELHSIGVGLTPLGIGADFYTLMTGRDAFTGENICGIWRYIGLIPLVSELRKGKKIISIADEVIEVGDEVIEVADEGSNLWKVGVYNELQGLEVGLQAHHVGQKSLMGKLVPGYKSLIAPAILVPEIGHVINMPGIGRVAATRGLGGFTNARSVIARDIFELRRVYGNQGIPNSSLQQLIQMNKTMYPEAFIKLWKN